MTTILLNLALGLSLEEVLSPLVLGQKLQLPGVDRTPPLGPDEVDRILVLHAELNQGHGDEDGGAAEAGDAVHPDASFRIVSELLLDNV